MWVRGDHELVCGRCVLRCTGDTPGLSQRIQGRAEENTWLTTANNSAEKWKVWVNASLHDYKQLSEDAKASIE